MIDPSVKKQYPASVIQELKIALKEIGTIKPVFDEDCQEYVFSHPLYASILAPGDTPKECTQTYIRMLAKFISERMKMNLAPHVAKMTSGRGGKRLGAGRPKTSPTQLVRIQERYTSWIKASPENRKKLEKWLEKQISG